MVIVALSQYVCSFTHSFEDNLLFNLVKKPISQCLSFDVITVSISLHGKHNPVLYDPYKLTT